VCRGRVRNADEGECHGKEGGVACREAHSSKGTTIADKRKTNEEGDMTFRIKEKKQQLTEDGAKANPGSLTEGGGFQQDRRRRQESLGKKKNWGPEAPSKKEN